MTRTPLCYVYRRTASLLIDGAKWTIEETRDDYYISCNGELRWGSAISGGEDAITHGVPKDIYDRLVDRVQSRSMQRVRLERG